MLQQPAVCASCCADGAHGCKPCRAANGAPLLWRSICGGGPNPLLNASACNDSINRLAACRSASRSSAVCLLWRRVKFRLIRIWNKKKLNDFVFSPPKKWHQFITLIGVIFHSWFTQASLSEVLPLYSSFCFKSFIHYSSALNYFSTYQLPFEPPTHDGFFFYGFRSKWLWDFLQAIKKQFIM